MLKAGLIVGIPVIVVAALATYVSPLCTPCAVILFAVVAGYLTSIFEKPRENSAAARRGALGGAIGGIGAVLGQMIGTAINASLMGPEGAAEFARSLGLQGGGEGFAPGYWAGVIGGALCFSVLDVLFMAGFGAAGGALWWQINGKQAATLPQ